MRTEYLRAGGSTHCYSARVVVIVFQDSRLKDKPLEMTVQKNNYLFFLVALFTLYYLCWQLQNHLLLNFDVSWLTFAAQQMLGGGNYVNNFLETNPPLIIYLYMPLVFLKVHLGISIIEGIKLYFFALSTVSLLLCYYLLSSIFLKKEQPLLASVLVVLAIIFLMLPVNEFGQREHFAIIFIFPYLLLKISRLQADPDWGRFFPLCIGLLAGIGFCVKPYFLLPFCLIEGYLIYQRGFSFSLFKPETLAVGLDVLLYLVLIFAFHPDYVQQILPLVTRFYYQRYQRSMVRMLGNEESFFNYFVLLFYFLRQDKLPYKNLTRLILLTAQGFWLVYLGQRMGWYYHALPFLALDLFLLFFTFFNFAQQERFSRYDWFTTSVLMAGLWSYFFYKIPFIRLSAYFFPYAYFCFFITIFFLLFYINACFKINVKRIASLLAIVIINIIFYHYLRLTIFYNHLFLLSTNLFILFFALLIPAATSLAKCRYLLLSLLGLLLFAIPAYKMAYIYDYACYYQMLYTQLTTAMKRFSSHKVLYLSNASEMAFPNIAYSGQLYASRFWSLVWLPSMKKPYDPRTYPAYLAENKQVLGFYLNALLTDLTEKKPEYVFVDRRAKGYYYTPPPDYLRLLSLHTGFLEAWKKYHFLYTLDSRPLFRLDVYQRKVD